MGYGTMTGESAETKIIMSNTTTAAMDSVFLERRYMLSRILFILGLKASR